jgi:hypothetical protein
MRRQARLAYSWENSCAQTAIIPTNSVSDANAAASSTNTFNMSASIVLGVKRSKRVDLGNDFPICRLVNFGRTVTVLACRACSTGCHHPDGRSFGLD